MAKKEICSGDLSIFYDEENFNHYLEHAKKIKDVCGKSKLANTNITGEDYYRKIYELVQVANMIMNKEKAPNLFDLIPLKKDGTFQKARRISIYDNGISYCESDSAGEYISGERITLAIVPYGINPWYEFMDTNEKVDEHRARLAITIVSGVRKLYPLLDRGLKIQNIKTKSTYIKQEDLKPGAIYKEKSGTEYLFLGGISIVSYPSTFPNLILTSKHKHIYGCEYLRVTKKVKDVLDGCNSLDEFLEKWAHVKLKTGVTEELGFSSRGRTSLRKFIEETSNPCPKGWIKVNMSGPNATPGLPEQSMFSINLKNSATGSVSQYDVYVEYDDTE